MRAPMASGRLADRNACSSALRTGSSYALFRPLRRAAVASGPLTEANTWLIPALSWLSASLPNFAAI